MAAAGSLGTMTKTSDPGAVPFGFESVAPEEKTRRVRGVFDSVARRYDLMNDVMSGGIHRLWKDVFVDRLRPRAGMRILDLAGGTGDIALRIARRAPDAHVTICDLTEGMVRIGRDRAFDAGAAQQIAFTVGNAEALPFPDRSVDACTIAFGLRNVTHPERALAEMRRVLVPGGRVLCLEFSTVRVPVLDRLYEAYSFNLVPWIGWAVARDKPSYQYLVESIARFPAPEELATMFWDAGFERVAWTRLSGGIAAIHQGWRL